MNYQNIFLTIIIVSIICGSLGILIAIFSRFFQTKNNQSEEKINEVLKRLPGYNCGGCGRAGCKNFAEAIVNENEDFRKCRPMKKEQKEEMEKYLKNN